MKSLLILCVLIVSGCNPLFWDTKYNCYARQTDCYDCPEDCSNYLKGEMGIEAKGYDDAEKKCLEGIGQDADWVLKCNLSCECIEEEWF